MPLTYYMREQNIKELILGTNYSGQTYLALSSTAIQPDGTGLSEPSGNGYERVSLRYNILGSNQANFPTNPTRNTSTDIYSITNTRDIYFKEATGSWGTLGYFAICNSSSGTTTILAYGTLTNSISPVANTIPVVRAGQLVISEQ